MSAPASAREAALGLVTIGQAPRTDLTPDVLPLLGPVRIVEHGALDLDDFDGPGAGRSRAALAPGPAEAPLVSRLRDGRSVRLGHRALAGRLRDAVARCERDGAGATLLLCTGSFPPVRSERPLLYAEPLVQRGVLAIAGADPVGVVCPLPEQRDDVRERWSALLPGTVRVAAADPYAEPAAALAQVTAAARELAAAGSRLLVLDCVGYTERLRAAAMTAGPPVLLARALAVRLAAETATGTPARGTTS